MVSEIVEHRDAVATPTVSSRRLMPLNCRSPSASVCGVDADASADRNRRQRVAHVVRTEQWRLESSEQCAVAMDVEPREPVAMLDRRSHATSPSSSNPKVSTGLTAVGTSAFACGLSAPRSSRPLRGTSCTRRRKASQDGIEIRVDVGVIELDVIDDGDIGQILEELRRLVEERAVVFIAFDDEVAALADAVARSLAVSTEIQARCRRRASSDPARHA